MVKRKMSENSLANLQTEKYKFSKDSPEVAQRAQEKSVESRKANKSFKEIMKSRLENIDEESGLTNKVAIADAMIIKAKQGDKAAAEFVRDTAGEKPVDKMAQTDSDGNDLVQPIINILPVEVRHDDNTDAEAVDVLIKQ